MKQYFKWFGYNIPTFLVLTTIGIPVFAVWLISLVKLVTWYSALLFG